MSDRKLIEQLQIVVSHLEKTCECTHDNTVVARNNALLMREHITDVKALLLQHGIKDLPDVIRENEQRAEENLGLLREAVDHQRTILSLQKALEQFGVEVLPNREVRQSGNGLTSD